MSQHEREAFEEYAEGYCYYLDKDSEGKYKNPATALAWQIWKAAKKSPPLDFSGSQIGNREAEEVIRTMWANGMESEAQALADCFYGLVDANAALAVQAQQPKIDQLKMIEIQDVLEALDADKTKGEVVNGNFDDATTAELPNLSSSAARVIRFLLAAQAQQPIGEVQHYAAPANLPAYVNVKWHGKPPNNGAKVYALPPAPEGDKE